MDKRMTITAHRGGAGLGPENTLACIERGLAAGADAIEIDVHLTADGEVVVCHDQTVDRTTDGKGRIDAMTFDGLRRLQVLTPDGGATGQHIPTLDEVLSLIGGRAQLLLEIKRTGHIYKGIERAVLERIGRHDARAWVVVQSFNDTVLEELRRLDPQLRLEKLLYCKLWGLPVIFDGGFTRFSFEKYEYVRSFNFYYRSITPRLAERIHARGKEVRVWTVDDPAQLPQLPLDGVITNRPDLFRKR